MLCTTLRRHKTIIECLKYATTGDLPPNSKGGAFIHDPKLCGEKEVLAQVKLSFRDASQEKMVVTRSLQLTVKKSGRQQKTLEGHLLGIKDGERASLSSRVAQLDLLMPHHLGVSKAILESVIFCHQDESLWPMSEPASLKKRFDEIFEALKYTKAIDNIKQLRKKQGDKLDKLKVTESAAKEVKAKGDKAENKSKELDAQLKVLRLEITELQAQIKEAKERSEHAWDQRNKYQNLLDTLDLRKEKERWLQSVVDKFRNRLHERSESDAWLQSELDNHQERVQIHEEHHIQQKEEYAQLDKAISTARERLGLKHGELGKHEQKKASHDQQIEDRRMLVSDTSRQHNIRGYETPSSNSRTNEFLQKLMKLSKDQNAAVEKARKETESEMEKVQAILTEVGEQKSKVTAEMNSSRLQLAAHDRSIRSARSELSQMNGDEGEIAVIQTRIGQLEIELKKARDEAGAASWDKSLQHNDKYLRALGEETKLLNDDMIQVTKNAGDHAQIEHLRKEIVSRQRSLDMLKSVHQTKLQALLEHKWQPFSLYADFQKILHDSITKTKDAEHRRASITRELEQIDHELDDVHKNLTIARHERDVCEKDLLEVVEDPREYPNELADLQAGRDVLKSDADGFVHLRGFYEQAIALAENRHKCRLCTRVFIDGQEKEQFVTAMKKKLKENDFAKTQNDLAAEEELLLKAKEAGSSYERWIRLTKIELPRLESTLKDLTSKRVATVREVEQQDQNVNEREQGQVDVESLAKAVTNITKFAEEIASLSEQLHGITSRQIGSSLPRTLEETRQQLDSVAEKSRDAVATRDKLSADKQRLTSRINTVELELVNAKANMSNANHQLEKRTAKSRQIDDLISASQFQRDTICQLDDQLQRLLSRLEGEQGHLDDIKQRGKQREMSIGGEATKLADSVYKLEQYEKSIRNYLDERGGEQLQRCQTEINAAEIEIQRVDQEQKRVIKSINRIGDELKSHKEMRRTIEDNIEFRKHLRDLDAIRTEIVDLSAQNAEADQQHWRDEADRWQHQLNKLSTQQTSKLGAAKAKDDQLASLIDDWDTDYKDAAYNYKRANIQVQATKAAIEDLGRYGGALDKAIMKYHSIKMEEINRIIEELWKKTYQGTDVDTILIRSDNEAATGNRSYNYRVSMIKQDAEMDMRGRCSAGQKVLASIIIRLALAECFGVNCGLIALDEPTTNLDRDNIRSLAQSLHDIIQTRRHQANFQLIVITHDEEFLRFMKCPDFCDHYYRVSRNDREKSIIEQQSIAEVM